MGSSLIGVTALCPWTRHIYPSLVLVQPTKIRPYITERLLMGRKESNQANTILQCSIPHDNEFVQINTARFLIRMCTKFC